MGRLSIVGCVVLGERTASETHSVGVGPMGNGPKLMPVVCPRPTCPAADSGAGSGGPRYDALWVLVWLLLGMSCMEPSAAEPGAGHGLCLSKHYFGSGTLGYLLPDLNTTPDDICYMLGCKDILLQLNHTKIIHMTLTNHHFENFEYRLIQHLLTKVCRDFRLGKGESLRDAKTGTLENPISVRVVRLFRPNMYHIALIAGTSNRTRKDGIAYRQKTDGQHWRKLITDIDNPMGLNYIETIIPKMVHPVIKRMANGTEQSGKNKPSFEGSPHRNQYKLEMSIMIEFNRILRKARLIWWQHWILNAPHIRVSSPSKGPSPAS